MRLSPEKKAQKKKIPTIDEYKKKHNYTKDMFMATAFSLGLALTPLMITGCNSGTPGSLKPKTQVKVKSKIKTKTKVKPSQMLGMQKRIEKTEVTLGEAKPLTKKIEKTQKTLGDSISNNKKDVPPCEVIENGEMRMGQRAVRHIDKKKPEIKKDIIDKVRRPKGQKPFKPKTKSLKGD